MSATSVPQPDSTPQQSQPLTGDAWLQAQMAKLEDDIVPHNRSTDGWVKYTKAQLRGILQAGREYPDLRVWIDLNLDMLRAWLLSEIEAIERGKA